MHDEQIVTGFTQQAEAFEASAVVRAADTLEGLIGLARPARSERWVEVACGSGIVSRTLAPLVAQVDGFDLTPAMIDIARREAAVAGLANARFEVGDATALPIADGTADGAIGRFCIHHLPVPARLFAELARIVRPGGTVVLVDHLADTDPDALAWSQEIERLRDPSHWASLPAARLRALGEQAGLTLEDEQIVDFDMHLGAWLERAHTPPAARTLITQALADRPTGTPCFAVRDGAELCLRMCLLRWRR